jgi:RNA-directed DNA polymerase
MTPGSAPAYAVEKASLPRHGVTTTAAFVAKITRRESSCQESVSRGAAPSVLTALLHHVYDVARLRAAFFALKKDAEPRVDGETWRHYELALETNLQQLSERLKRGAYRAKPVRRAYIPKADGRQRPLGVPVLEDKIVQRATVDVLNAIYETDFLGFSYGFRPGRSQHHALDALYVGLLTKPVNWVLDVDIRAFFDTIDHGWLIRFLEHRLADQRVVRLIQKWLNAGVLEEGQRRRVEEGTPQGGSVSPLLANVYLHYVFDLWVHAWRQKCAHGSVIVVRYADDIVLGFQAKSDAERFRTELVERFRRFHLEVHPEKTRLLEFGPYAADNQRRRGLRKPETFHFLGFTHICGKKRSNGRPTHSRFLSIANPSMASRRKLDKNLTNCRIRRPGRRRELRLCD